MRLHWAKTPLERQKQADFLWIALLLAGTTLLWLPHCSGPTPHEHSERGEGRSGLAGVYLSADAYRGIHGEFPAEFRGPAHMAPIGFAVNGKEPRFQYFLVSTRSGWAASANTMKPMHHGKHENLRTNARGWFCRAFDSLENRPATPALAPGSPTDCAEATDGSSAEWVPTFLPRVDVPTAIETAH